MSAGESTSGSYIKQALQLQYSAELSDSFVAFLKEEEFDEAILIDDVKDVDPDDLSNSNVVDHLVTNFPKVFSDDNSKQRLLLLLQNALKGVIPQGVEVKLIDPNSIQWGITRQQSKAATQFISKNCPNLIEDKEKGDRAMMDVIAMGTKNGIPLLNWLYDTYSRYRLNQFYLHKRDETSTTSWAKEYAFFAKLEQSKVLEKLSSSIKSFGVRLFNGINLAGGLSIIDDNMTDFIEYYIAMNETVTLLSSKPVIPFQVDMWIIPQNAVSAVEADQKTAEPDPEEEPDSDHDGDDEEIGLDSIGDIESRLKANGFVYERIALSQKTKAKRIMVERMEAMLDGKRNQRLMVYIDRRDPELVGERKKTSNDPASKTWNDVLYFVQAPDKCFGELPAKHTPETSLWATTQCMMPKVQEESDTIKGWGCRNDFNGFQFTLSWHVDSDVTSRCYWFCNCGGTRFFPYDAACLWPQFFAEGRNKARDAQKEKLKGMTQCGDAAFEHWFENTTKTKLVPYV